jgi:hypothetical protein
LLLAIFLATALATALPIMGKGRSGGWLVAVAALLVPTIVIVAFGGGLPGDHWPLLEFVADVTLPLALLGIPVSQVGIDIGVLVRRRRIRKIKIG